MDALKSGKDVIDLVLLDLYMPGSEMDGFEVLQLM
jgi:CheY-like chemotaxis protein